MSKEYIESMYRMCIDSTYAKQTIYIYIYSVVGRSSRSTCCFFACLFHECLIRRFWLKMSTAGSNS